MPNHTINIAVNKIYYPQTSGKQAALAAAWICGHLKGIHLKILDIKKSSSLADYFVLTSTRNSIQANSIATEILRQFKRLNFSHLSREGERGDNWILLDASPIIIHIFVESAREQYDLDTLYSQAAQIPIPHEYYTTSGHQASRETATYF